MFSEKFRLYKKQKQGGKTYAKFKEAGR